MGKRKMLKRHLDAWEVREAYRGERDSVRRFHRTGATPTPLRPAAVTTGTGCTSSPRGGLPPADCWN